MCGLLSVGDLRMTVARLSTPLWGLGGSSPFSGVGLPAIGVQAGSEEGGRGWAPTLPWIGTCVGVGNARTWPLVLFLLSHLIASYPSPDVLFVGDVVCNTRLGVLVLVSFSFSLFFSFVLVCCATGNLTRPS